MILILILIMALPIRAEAMDETELLARVIQAESGCDWCSDTMQMYVGSVVLNRITSPEFPNDMESVVFQTGQYSTAGIIKNVTPSERAMENARYLMTNGSVLNCAYVYQANFKQGTDVIKEQNMFFGKGNWRDESISQIHEWEFYMSGVHRNNETVSSRKGHRLQMLGLQTKVRDRGDRICRPRSDFERGDE